MSVDQKQQIRAESTNSKQAHPETIHLQTTTDHRVPKNRVAVPSWRMLYRWFLTHTYAPQWLPDKWNHPITGYIVAIFLELIAAFITILVLQLFPSTTFAGLLAVLAVALVALNWGVGPSLFATLTGAALLIFVIEPPRFTWTLNETGLVEVFLSLLVGVTISIVASQIEKARRNAEELAISLTKERARLEAVFESITDGVFLFNSEKQILRMNTAARELIAVNQQSDYPSLSADKRMPLLAMRDEHGRLLEDEEWPMARILNGEVLKGSNASDVIVRTLDGREVELSVSGAPVRNHEGELIGALCVCRDVTERRQLEKRTQATLTALLAMAETLVLMSDNPTSKSDELSPDAMSKIAHRMAELTCSVLGCDRVSITAIEPETDVLNPIAVVGLSPEQERQWWDKQQQGARLSDSPDPSLVAQLRADELLLLDITQPPYNNQPNLYNIRTMLIAPMIIGEQLVGLLSLDYGGQEHDYTNDEIAITKAVAKLAALVIERDRLLRERAEARANELALREANRRMDEFLGMTSHELKTPLTSIMGNTQLTVRQLRNSMLNFQKMQGMLESTERQIKFLDRLVNDLLDISRPQEQQLDMNLAPCNLASIVREVVEEQRLASPNRVITFDIPDEMIVPVLADTDRINQVLRNYLTNALKYSPEEKPVQVTLQVDEKNARVSVQDEGNGLSPEEQTHVWERFYRAHHSETPGHSASSNAGLGLGLYICKTIIEQHRGNVGVESTPNAGSTFWFTLPLAPSTEPPTQ